MTLTSTINNEKCRFRLIALAVILFFYPGLKVLLDILENTKRQLHYILFAIGNPKKKRASYKNPQLIWEYLAMHN